MDAEVEKLAEKAENLEIKKKSPKEWNDLPLEMKEEVVKHVDFKSSLRLRQTARAERTLVDSKKFAFSKVRVEKRIKENGNVTVEEVDKNYEMKFFFSNQGGSLKNLRELLAHILNTGKIETLYLDNSDFIPTAVRLLDKCVEPLGSVNIVFEDFDCTIPLREMTKIYNTNVLKFDCPYDSFMPDDFSNIVRTFADRRNVLGKTIVFRTYQLATILEYPANNRQPSYSVFVKDGDRIPTNDSSIEILFEIHRPELDAFEGVFVSTVKMHTVPAREL